MSSKLDLCNSFDDLFRRWKDAQSGEIDADYLKDNIPKYAFLPDGIIDAHEYNNASKKILFVAKEANWYCANKSYDDLEAEQMFWHREVAQGNVSQTAFSKRLSMVANAIISDDYINVDKNHNVLYKVSVINLNKRGGYPGCDYKTLREYTIRYSEYISKEIDMINPELIVCCGWDVYDLINNYVSVNTGSELIWIYHPSYFGIPDVDYLEQLNCAIHHKEWVRRK